MSTHLNSLRAITAVAQTTFQLSVASVLAIGASCLYGAIVNAQDMTGETPKTKPNIQATDKKSAPTLPLKNLDFDAARHLVNRAGLGGNLTEVQQYVGLSPDEAAKKMLSPQSRFTVDPPSWVSTAFDSPRVQDKSTVEVRQEYNRRQNVRITELREWWLTQMVQTEAPLAERMTLFWHNHFATSNQKVRPAQWMWRQHMILRDNALGNFSTMLNAVAKDPAMIIYLDGINSKKEQPNENFAREVMELFTLGEGNYTEKDIKEAARAFTGWSVDRETGEFLFRKGAHDPNEKLVLGARGKLDGEAVIKVLLQQPRTAEFITEKLWKELVSPTPDKVEVKRLAAIFRDSGYEMKPLVQAILSSQSFYAAENRGAIIKSPVDLVVGTVRAFGMKAERMNGAVGATALLGQTLFAPPNVKGWPGGESWVNSASLLNRKQFVERIFRGEDRFAMMVSRMEESMSDDQVGARERRVRRQMERGVEGWLFDAETWTKQFGTTKDVQRKQAEKLVLAIAPVAAGREQQNHIDWLRALGTDPAYQLK